MLDHNINIIVLVLLILCVMDNSEGERCIAAEREALLKFKQGLIDDQGILSSWGCEAEKKECCNWYGISCHNATNHMMDLRIHHLKGEISSSLLDLQHLNTLDLNSNHFGGNTIPSFIGSMTKLQYLDLGSCRFHGTIPPQLGNLTRLTYLDLSQNNLNGSIPGSFEKLTSLWSLDLSRNMLDGMIPKCFGNFSHLVYLTLNDNNLDGPLAELLGNLSNSKGMLSLEFLDLSRNQLTGLMPDLNTLVFLKSLYLRNNRVMGSLPESLGQQTELVVLDVSSNSMDGIISEANFMSLHNLEILDLSFNSFRMQISPKWNPPFQTKYLFLSSCDIGPRFPIWIRGQKNLEALDLSNNGISDEAPRWLWSLFPSTTTFLNLSYNHIHGTIPDISSISTWILDITSNNFSGPFPLFHPNTSIVQISNNKFNGSISSICLNQVYPNLALFDASNNEFEGVLPNCWERMVKLRILNLGNNFFSGEIPPSLGFLWNLETLHLNDNFLSGVLPQILRNCSTLKLINFQRNKLTGSIPNWIGASFESLMYLIFSGNKFSGSIPKELCNATRIQLLDLSRNNISGKIPGCFDKFTLMVQNKGKGSSNQIKIPLYGTLSTFVLEQFYRFFSDYAIVEWKGAVVQWKGQESDSFLQYHNNLKFLTLIDLSSNKLGGSIPRELFSLQGLVSLNLSRNCLTGCMDPNIVNMSKLESLDLSRNQLEGNIPIGLAQLHYLQVMDLCHNNLSGEIPRSTQLQSFNALAYDGNTGLCGKPLSPCPEDGNNSSTNSRGGQGYDDEKENGFMKFSFEQDLGISMAFGFIFGFWGIIAPLLLKKSWRVTYYRFLGGIGVWLYVKTVLLCAKFRRS